MRTPHTVFHNRRLTIARALIVSLIGVALVSIGLGSGGAAAGSMKLDTITVGVNPVALVFDGHNIWVSNNDGTITKIRIH